MYKVLYICFLFITKICITYIGVYVSKHKMDATLNENVCVICMTETNEPIYANCNCSTFTHRSCVNQWRNVRSDNYGKTKCEVCNADYNYTVATNISPLPKLISIVFFVSFINIFITFCCGINSVFWTSVLGLITFFILAFFKYLQYFFIPIFWLAVSVFVLNYPRKIVLYDSVYIESYLCGILVIVIGVLVSVVAFRLEIYQRDERSDETLQQSTQPTIIRDLITSMH